MGTTVTAALVSGPQVTVGHVGDSRCYLVRDGELEQLTEDHSLVADLVRSGRLTPEEAEVHPQRSVITRALGTDAAVAVDSFAVEARDGDVFLLCSDGLTSMIDEDAVLQAVRETATLEEAARALIEAANGAGGEDNITVVLFSVGSSDPDEDTLSGLEGIRIPVMPDETSAPPDHDARDLTVVNRRSIRKDERERRGGGSASKALLIGGGILLLFVALAAAALFGLSRAHFVGATDDGHVAVYQGVPWNFIGGTKLYREIYVSSLLTEQLSEQERQQLFDHDLMSESAAKGRIAPYERQAEPPR
jgi:protein phosphatase